MYASRPRVSETILSTGLDTYFAQRLSSRTALTQLVQKTGNLKSRTGTVYTPKEILQQPWTWLDTAQRIKAQASGLKSFLIKAEILGRRDSSRAKVILAGAGTSDYVGKSILFHLRRRLQTEVLAIPSTDILTNYQDIFLPRGRYLMISFSRSGESPEGVKSIEITSRKFPRVAHLIVTCNAAGAMVRYDSSRSPLHSLVLHEATHDQGLAMTSSYTNMVLAGLGLGYLDEMETFLNQTKWLAVAGENLLLKYAGLAESLANQEFQRFCFLGTGNLSGAAMEAALKLRELTDGKLVTLPESFLGVRHGPISGLDHNTLMVGFLSSDSYKQRYELDLLRESKGKNIGSTQCVVCQKVPASQKALAHHWVEFGLSKTTGLIDDFRPCVDILFAQMLGLFSCLHYHLQPDQPSARRVISRVVSGIKIYDT